MSDANKSRPVFIKATNVNGLTMSGNTVIGDADFAHLENVTDLVAHGNEHITPPDTSLSKVNSINDSTTNPPDTKPVRTEERKSISLTKIAEKVIGSFVLLCLVYLAAQYFGIPLRN